MLFRLEGDFATHAWLIPAIPIVVIALLVMARFLRHLPPTCDLCSSLASPSSRLGRSSSRDSRASSATAWVARGGPSRFFPASVALEESLEFIGVIIVVAGIVAHLDRIGLFTRPEPAVSTPTGTEAPVHVGAPLRANGPS